MIIARTLVSQFHHPKGIPGLLAGWIMANRSSNLQRNLWTADLLQLSPSDHVLELGPGPGITLKTLLEKTPKGMVTAIDHSALMLKLCARNNRAALAAGRLVLIQGSFTDLQLPAAQYDRIIAVNSLQFDGMQAETICHIVSLLKPGGTIAVTFQPRGKNPSNEKAEQFAEKIVALFAQAGLQSIRTERLPLQPVSALCVIGSVIGRS